MGAARAAPEALRCAQRRGYFDGLLAFLDRAADEQLLFPQNRALLLVESDPVRLVERFRAYTPPAIETWLKRGQL